MAMSEAALARWALAAMLGAAVWANGQCDPTELDDLLAADRAEVDRMGDVVAIDGDTLLAVAPGDDTQAQNAGSVHVFVRDGGVWSEQGELTASDGKGFTDLFGTSVAIAGDVAIVGAPRHFVSENAGCVYVYTRTAGVWSEHGSLYAPDRLKTDEFGWAVAIEDNTAAVGAIEGDVEGDHAGGVYVFTNSEGVWTETAKVTPSDGVHRDGFGKTLSLQGDTLAVGCYGRAATYVFTRMGGAWIEEAVLPLKASSLAVDHQRVVIGVAPNDAPGEAHVYNREGGVWTQQAKLTASDGSSGDLFGSHVAIQGERILIGAPLDDTPAGINAGSAYLFSFREGAWSEQAHILASDGSDGDFFGSVALNGETMVVGARGNDVEGVLSAGSVYIFDLACPQPCYPDCDTSGALDLFDFLCFQNQFVAADPYADCTADGAFDLFDFLCYVNAFNDGCP